MNMFSTIELWRCDLPCRLSFNHNLASRTRIETFIVRMRDNNGNEGYGQALPRDYLTGENLDSVEKDIRQRWWPGLLRLDIAPGLGFDGLLDRLAPLYREADQALSLAAYGAVEMAAADVYLRAGGIAPEWPGASPSPMPLVGVISADGPGKAFWTAQALRRLGYKRFKVKVGTDEALDRERLAAVRRAVGPDCQLAVDANAAWVWDEAVDRMRALAEFGVVLVEEPLFRDVDGDYRLLRELTGRAIMADESLCSLADAKELLRRGSPDWWNLRLGKNGGFSGVRALAGLARENGIHVYGGVLVGETSALAAAGRTGMWLAGAEMAEYGFPRFLLRGDPFRGGPGGYAGTARRSRPRKPGFGVRLRRDLLAKVGKLSWRDEG